MNKADKARARGSLRNIIQWADDLDTILGATEQDAEYADAMLSAIANEAYFLRVDVFHTFVPAADVPPASTTGTVGMTAGEDDDSSSS